MRRYFQCRFILFFAFAFLTACGGGSDSGAYLSETGDFLALTVSQDESHYSTLVRVNGQTGEVTNIGGGRTLAAMAYAPDGTLYGVSDGLCVIEPTTGATDWIGGFSGEGGYPILMTSATFSPEGTLYVVANGDQRVFTVDLSNAALSYVGTPSELIRGLAFSPNGTLYGSFGSLYTINPATMDTISRIGSAGLDGTGPYISTLTFGRRGDLFGIDAFPSTNIYSINLLTGLATPLFSTVNPALVSLVRELQ